MKIVIECVIIYKQHYRETIIDLKHTFLMKYMITAIFRPNSEMSKNATFHD
eukprot:UN08505